MTPLSLRSDIWQRNFATCREKEKQRSAAALQTVP